jgi:carbamoylphosphate synthase small subunit
MIKGELKLVHPVHGNVIATFVGDLFGDLTSNTQLVGEVVFQTGQVGYV